MATAKEHAAYSALPAVSDMQQFVALQALTRGEESVAHIAREAVLVILLMLGEIRHVCEDRAADFTDDGLPISVERFVFYQLWCFDEAQLALLTPKVACSCTYRFKAQNGNPVVYALERWCRWGCFRFYFGFTFSLFHHWFFHLAKRDNRWIIRANYLVKIIQYTLLKCRNSK